MTIVTRAKTFDPALTHSEWAAYLAGQPFTMLSVVAYLAREDSSVKYPAAAVALHGQKFGFTPEDVAMLRSVAAGNPDGLPGYGLPIIELANRIEALLPPK